MENELELNPETLDPVAAAAELYQSYCDQIPSNQGGTARGKGFANMIGESDDTEKTAEILAELLATQGDPEGCVRSLEQTNSDVGRKYAVLSQAETKAAEIANSSARAVERKQARLKQSPQTVNRREVAGLLRRSYLMAGEKHRANAQILSEAARLLGDQEQFVL